MSPEQQRLRARLGAHTSWANTADRASRTAPGRAAADARFERQAREQFPNLPDDEIHKIAANARAAHYAGMQLKAAQAKAAKRAAKSTGKQ